MPAFLWFSTRLFASIRTSLNQIYDVSRASARPPRHFLVSYLLGKARDVVDGHAEPRRLPGQHRC